MYPFVHPHAYLSMHPYSCPGSHPRNHLFIHPCSHPSIHKRIYLHIKLTIQLPTHVYMHLSTHSFIHTCIHAPRHLTNHPSTCPAQYPSIQASSHLFFLPRPLPSFYLPLILLSNPVSNPKCLPCDLHAPHLQIQERLGSPGFSPDLVPFLERTPT